MHSPAAQRPGDEAWTVAPWSLRHRQPDRCSLAVALLAPVVSHCLHNLPYSLGGRLLIVVGPSLINQSYRLHRCLCLCNVPCLTGRQLIVVGPSLFNHIAACTRVSVCLHNSARLGDCPVQDGMYVLSEVFPTLPFKRFQCSSE